MKTEEEEREQEQDLEEEEERSQPSRQNTRPYKNCNNHQQQLRKATELLKKHIMLVL